MSFEKIKKEDWLKLSKEEQDFLNLEFQKDIEKRKRIVIIATRSIAIFCIFALFYIGYAQLQASKGYNQIMEKYGSLGYCYMCGKEALRLCECQYHTYYSAEGKYHPLNLTEISESAAEYNILPCKVKSGLSSVEPYKKVNLTVFTENSS